MSKSEKPGKSASAGKSAAKPAAAANAKAPAIEAPRAADWRGKLFLYLLPLLLFLTVNSFSSQYVVGLTIVVLFFCVGREPAALGRTRCSMLSAAVIVYASLLLFSGLWSHFRSYAYWESLKVLTALLIFALLLFRLRREHLRHLLWMLAGLLALVGLLCIDGSASQILCRGLVALLKLTATENEVGNMGYETGVRIIGIYNNANVSAGMLALGLVVALYLFRTAKSERARFLASLILGMQALAFFLSFSMGAMAAFGVTCVVYLVVTEKDKRFHLLVLMVEAVIVTVLLAFLCNRYLGTGSAIPELLALVSGPVIWVLHRFVGGHVSAFLTGHQKAAVVAICALAVLAVGYVFLAFRVTGALRLEPGAPISRAVKLDAGEYSVTDLRGEGAVEVLVYTQNEKDLMMHTNTELYSGALETARFTVPSDSRVVWFVLSGEGTLDEVRLSDGSALTLGYRLLPAFAANRLQGLWANQNLIQRLVFFRDGIRLWLKSPIIGWGAGGVEGQLTAVQEFFYESKYIHNHYIEMLDVAGILGLAAFLFLLFSAVRTLLRCRRQRNDPMLAMLGACLTMMFFHSLTEVVWSTMMYLVVVFTLLAVLVILDSSDAPKRGARALNAALSAVLALFCLMQLGSTVASYLYRTRGDDDMTREEYVDFMGRLDAVDVYFDTIYKTNRMANALKIGESQIARKCAEELMRRKEYDSCYYVAAYYYYPRGDLGNFFNALRIGLEQEASNAQAWSSALDLVETGVPSLEPELVETYVNGIVDIGDRMDRFNEGRMGPIELSESAQRLLNAARTVKNTGLRGESAQEMLNLLLGL